MTYSISFSTFSGIFTLALVLLCKATVSASTDRDYRVLRAEYADWKREWGPELSTSKGYYKYNDKLSSISVAAKDNTKKQLDYFMGKLNDIDRNSLSADLQTDYGILKSNIQTVIDGYKWRLYTGLNPINMMEGIQRLPGWLPSVTPFDTLGDFENYIRRVEQIPKANKEIIQLMNTAIKMDRTLHNVSMDRVRGQFDQMLNTTTEEFVWFTTFNKSLENTSFEDSEKNELRKRAFTAVTEMLKSYKELKTYITMTYNKHLRPGLGVMHWDNGKEFYKAALKWHTTVDMSPEEVHAKGREEVNRIYNNMVKTIRRLGFQGTPREFYASLKGQDSKYFTTDKTFILEKYRNIVLKQIPPKLSKFFSDIPDAEVRVEPTPTDGSLAYYVSGKPDGTRPGTFYINLNRPRDMSLNGLMVLSIHETLPGHHFQISYAQTLDIPKYRLDLIAGSLFQVPFNFPLNTAYIEGWALYTEYLGEEMGLYTDDYLLMGRYSLEMLRACRLVVDTGIHYFNWTREKAVEHMLNYTSQGRESVEAEVDRYVSLPGQACAYKIGEIKIKELRRKAEEVLGKHFNIKDFHKEILRHGIVSLNVLETFFNSWLEAEKLKIADTDIDLKCPSSASALHSNINSLILVMLMYVIIHMQKSR